jgi:hypothetical protein
MLKLLLLLFLFISAGDDLPPSSGDADEGWQWDVQINEG